ncbi:MAG: hypothetical protein HUU46_23360 [Candidatus Hydrogenedentes bacterium]|nr:hypothetical protein [Candidatus Hydrogenedentota bacterium]
MPRTRHALALIAELNSAAHVFAIGFTRGTALVRTNADPNNFKYRLDIARDDDQYEVRVISKSDNSIGDMSGGGFTV